MIEKLKNGCAVVVAAFIMLGSLVGLVLYCLLGGVAQLSKREARPDE